ncbi:MAG: carbohydrate-binding domain-containing protein [Paludibacteraceae bacterium]|nr:carbohydrate-binding domain-containing protein [Paludibacteraceae bacterium]
MRKTSLLITAVLMTACLIGCSKKDEPEEVDKDLVENFEFKQTVTVNFGANATPVISNPLNGKGVEVTVSGGDVVITSTVDEDVEYLLTGTTTNGSVKIYSDKKYKVTLSNADITSVDKPALNLQSSKRVYLVQPAGSVNKLTDSGEYETDRDYNSDGEDRKGVLFCEGQVIFSGSGTLEVNAFVKHAIASDEYIRIREGNFKLYSDNGDGIHVKEYLWVQDCTMDIAAHSDGIQCSKGYINLDGGTLNIQSRDDCIRATYGLDSSTETDTSIVTDITINGGRITLVSEKLKDTAYGIYTTGQVLVGGGDITATVFNAANAVFGAKGVLTLNDHDWNAHYTYHKP